MREILFRGKRVDNGEWVYGWLFQTKYDTKKYLIRTFPDKDDNYEDYVVIPETIGQHTGLKDENGNKIFEGDILRDYGNDIEDWVVSYEYGGFVGTFDNVCENLYEIHDLEVIGTIHDGGDSSE